MSEDLRELWDLVWRLLLGTSKVVYLDQVEGPRQRSRQGVGGIVYV
jgi:hypothetical protein